MTMIFTEKTTAEKTHETPPVQLLEVEKLDEHNTYIPPAPCEPPASSPWPTQHQIFLTSDESQAQ